MILTDLLFPINIILIQKDIHRQAIYEEFNKLEQYYLKNIQNFITVDNVFLIFMFHKDSQKMLSVVDFLPKKVHMIINLGSDDIDGFHGNWDSFNIIDIIC